MTPLRIAQIGLGPLGQRVARDLESRGVGTIAAAVDLSPDRVGRRVSDAVEGAQSDTAIAGSLDAIDAAGSIDAAIVTTLSDLAKCADTFRALLERGLPIVSTCEELLFPNLRHPELAAEFHDIATRTGGRLLGTGINPGFLMDLLPVVCTGVCRSVDHIFIERVQDATTRRVPFQAKIGATLNDNAFTARVADGTLRHVGLGESLHFVCDALGLRVDDWSESIEPIRAETRLQCALGVIEPGTASGVRQVAIATRDAQEVARLEFSAAIGQADPRDRIVVRGEPDLEVIIPGAVHGDVGTSSVVINCLRPIIDASAGLHTMATIRPVHFDRGNA